MLEPNANFIAAIEESELRIAEIYDFTLISGQVFRYTSHAQNLIWNAGDDTYVAIPLTRSMLHQNINLEVDEVEISLSNISNDFTDALQNNVLNNIAVTIKRIIWDETYASDMEITKFIGVGDVSFNRRDLTIQCKSILDSLNIQVPRDEWQEPCNKLLFDVDCSLVEDTYKYTGVVATGDNISFTDVIRGPVYKLAFDNGDINNPIGIGDAITGGPP
jgi:hypothetical protein